MHSARCLAIVLPVLVALGCTSTAAHRSGPSGSPGPAGEGRPATPPDDGRLRIIAFGAHPDDCELRAGGVAAMWASQGHHVKFVSVTNGDIGHWKIAGGPLARRRTEEVEEVARRLGIMTQVLDHHDGEIEPSLEIRREITRLIRGWKADIVLTPRTNDYHPDHRYTAINVQDAAYMVTVPFFCPDTPHLTKNPVFLYTADGFQKPNPFRPDVVVSIDPVLEKKVDALAVMTSQFHEGGANGSEALMPKDEAGRAARDAEVRKSLARRAEGAANQFREKLVELYGEERGRAVKAAEAFEVCEYGGRPSREELMRLFPFFR